MLSIAAVSSHHATHYYDTDNYTSLEEAETASQWVGHSCDTLSLQGQVDGGIFATLLNGYTPEQQRLHQTFQMHHVAAVDLTLSAPKSVSLAALWRGTLDLLNAHRQAVKTMLTLIETHSGARHWNGHQSLFSQTGNLLIAQFGHSTSRAQDPQLHTHNVVLNTTHTGNDWRALDTRPLFKYRKLWQTVYHQDLAIHIQQLGYAVTRHHGHLELTGYTPEQLDYWSKRRQQILQTVGPGASRRQKQVACLRTRQRKQTGYSLTKLRQRWTEENLRMGFDVQHPVPGLPQVPNKQDRIAAARAALEHLTQSLGLTESLETLTLIQQVFGNDGWGNPDQPFGYQDLAHAIADATDNGHLYNNNGQLSRSSQIAMPLSQAPTTIQVTPSPDSDAVEHFTQAIANNKQAVLMAPVNLHSHLTHVVRQRLKQLGILNTPHTARQRTVNGVIDVTVYAGERLWIPGRAGPVPAQVTPGDCPEWVRLNHRNGKVTTWNLSAPKAFDFAWVQPPHRLPKQSIDEIYLIGDISDEHIRKLRQKSRTPITVYRLAPERDVLTQPEPTPLTAPERER
ncbi:MAG: MobF family relaxase [Cyanobacteria bacterium J06642_11]